MKKLTDNFDIWTEHYFDELWYQYNKFNLFLESGGSPKTEFIIFCRFIYNNTTKIKHPYLNKLVASIV